MDWSHYIDWTFTFGLGRRIGARFTIWVKSQLLFFDEGGGVAGEKDIALPLA